MQAPAPPTPIGFGGAARGVGGAAHGGRRRLCGVRSMVESARRLGAVCLHFVSGLLVRVLAGAGVDERIDENFDERMPIEVIERGSAMHCVSAYEARTLLDPSWT